MATKDTARTRAQKLWDEATPEQRKRFEGTRTEALRRNPIRELTPKKQRTDSPAKERARVGSADAAQVKNRQEAENLPEGLLRGGKFGTYARDIQRRR
jgi:hypothetical protein